MKRQAITKQRFTLLLFSLLLSNSLVNAADQPLPPLETYKSKYIFVPGLPGTLDKWGSSASLEEIWDQAPDLQFQVVPVGAFVNIGTTIGKLGATAASTIGSAVRGVVSNAGGLAGIITKTVPTVAALTMDVAVQQIAAGQAASAANAENKAVMAQLIAQNEADKALAKQQSDAALELEQLKQQTAQKQAEEETKRAQLLAEAVKKQAEEETKRVAAQAEAAKEIAKGAAANKVTVPQTPAVVKAKENLKEAAKKDVAADKDLQQKVGQLVTATQKIPEVVNQELAKAGVSGATSFLSPKIGLGSQFTSATEPKGKSKMTAKKFQQVCIKEGKTEGLIGSIADRIQKESLVFDKALDDLLKAKSARINEKDLGPQIRAVDASAARLQKLFSKNEETAKNYEELIAETDSYDYDSDEDLDLLFYGEDDDDELNFYSDAELDDLLDDEEELKELDAEIDALMKEIDEMDDDAA